ncbi:MAG: endonuclease III [Steroidobacteraceae bacterium]|nr:endonuclease III [Steroidobacteraceae bacterium]
MHPSRVRAIFRRLQAANPRPTTELEYSTPFELLVAVALSAHTTDKSVNAATRQLFPVANTPQKILALGVEGVKPYIKPVGLYNTKSKNLIELCRRLVEEHGGDVPRDRAALESLPGVGRKTANVILNMVFGETTIAVDTHIFRVANRTGLAEGSTPRAVEDQLNEVVPAEYKKDAHHWLILHGRYVCTARLPACPRCIISDLCEYPNKTAPRDLSKSDALAAGADGSAPARSAAARPAVARVARPKSGATAAKTRASSGRASSTRSSRGALTSTSRSRRS